MYRAIKLNEYKFSDIQITESVISFTKKIAMHCKFYSEAREICNALQIS